MIEILLFTLSALAVALALSAALAGLPLLLRLRRLLREDARRDAISERWSMYEGSDA